MKNIPNISFQGAEGATKIEFLKLSELFSRIQEDPNHDPKRPHRLDFFALLIVTEGTGTHQVDLKKYALRKGSVVKIAKNQVHAFQDDLNYQGYLVVFTEEFVLKYFSRSSIEFLSHLYNYHLSLPLVEKSSYNESFLFDFLAALKSENQYAQMDILAKLLELYLLRLDQQTQGSFKRIIKNEFHQIFTNFKNLVEKNYTETRNVKDYADWLHISPKHLNHVVREVTLNTAKTFIDQYVILEIKRSILSTDNSLKEVAFSTGFEEVTNFTKFFKKHTGLSPKEFKTNI
ncbi:helix-turn-helix transcriptional regulator [Cyclobacterium amurskyense]|uniref:AraC family transcriptional regulator n=1 Tax=Cyclobacterium amurskyense TaxID=320787 RepID=UPI0030D83AAA